jgi:hypothetical protein
VRSLVQLLRVPPSRYSLGAGVCCAVFPGSAGARMGMAFSQLPSALVLVAVRSLRPCMKRRVRLRPLACFGAASAVRLFVLPSGCLPPPTPVEQELHAAKW